MGKFIKNFMTYFSICIALSACAPEIAEPFVPDVQDEALPVNAGIPRELIKEEYVTFYGDKSLYTLTAHEPEAGCYLGAYILSNKQYDYDINAFESLTGVCHAIYSYFLNLGDDIPVNWLLSCISQQKTPFIIIQAASNENPFDKESIEFIAECLGEYNIPMMVEIHPNPMYKGYNSASYIEFFRYAGRVFREKAPLIALIYSISQDEVNNCMEYYPGDAYVDWVGITLYDKLNDKGKYDEDQAYKKLDDFYFLFQKKKPIIITEYAVSHYTTLNHNYYVYEAGDRLAYFYNKLADHYPRIKAVVYMDFNAAVLSADNKGDDFRISDNDILAFQYSDSVNNKTFINELITIDKNTVINDYYRLEFPVLMLEKQDGTCYFYLPANNRELNLNILNSVYIDGNKYYDIQSDEFLSLYYTIIDETTKKITILLK